MDLCATEKKLFSRKRVGTISAQFSYKFPKVWADPIPRPLASQKLHDKKTIKWGDQVSFSFNFFLFLVTRKTVDLNGTQTRFD